MQWLRRSVQGMAVLAMLSAPVQAEVKVPTVFSAHMVLQRSQAVPVWGRAGAGEEVTVSFRDQKKTAKADADGKWMVKLDPLMAGGPDKLVIQGTNTLTIEDVLVGEVWVGSGQSNMAGGVNGYLKGDEVLAKLASGTYPKLRLLKTRGGTWQTATEPNIKGFSALLFAFGQQLQADLDVPVGLMVGAVGGTPSGRWLSEEALLADEGVRKLLSKDGKVELPRDKKVGDLYEAFIRPIIPYGIRGVLWDQGESGTAVPGVDQLTLMGALIRGWRKEWGQGELPFLYVQKPSGGGCAWDPMDPITRKADPFSPLPAKTPAQADGLYRELHIRIMNYPNTAMVSASDLGSGVHPVNKSGYGQRGARVALGMVYEKKIEIYGPIYSSHKIEGDRVRITFGHTGKGLAWRHGDRLQGFMVAGKDKVFHWADAEIDGEAVIVKCNQVPQPVAVRYAWSRKHPWANLFNKDGLPALTFRTDDW